jgi:hypothetical protein
METILWLKNQFRNVMFWEVCFLIRRYLMYRRHVEIITHKIYYGFCLYTTHGSRADVGNKIFYYSRKL